MPSHKSRHFSDSNMYLTNKHKQKHMQIYTHTHMLNKNQKHCKRNKIQNPKRFNLLNFRILLCVKFLFGLLFSLPLIIFTTFFFLPPFFLLEFIHSFLYLFAMCTVLLCYSLYHPPTRPYATLRSIVHTCGCPTLLHVRVFKVLSGPTDYDISFLHFFPSTIYFISFLYEFHSFLFFT